MQSLLFESIPITEITLPLLNERSVCVDVLRLDTIHAVISGNKWFKLKYHLEEARSEGKDHLVTFGGAFSNHIVATAAAGAMSGFRTSGIIRGERPRISSHTLQMAEHFGMTLFFSTRADYHKKFIPPELNHEIGNAHLINEGGYGHLGVKGAAEILNYCDQESYSHIACAVGTSTMMAGLVVASSPQQEVLGICVMKAGESLDQALLELLPPGARSKKFQLLHQFHFGGYAKHTTELIAFMNNFYKHTGVPSDFVYTGKLFYAIINRIECGLFPPGSRILLIHSGGLQGNLSLPKGSLIF